MNDHTWLDPEKEIAARLADLDDPASDAPPPTIDALPEAVRRSFLAAYDLPEMTLHERNRAGHGDAMAAVPVPSAYSDGVQLRMAMIGVYSADTEREFVADTALYDDVAAGLNRRYGNIVLTVTEAGPHFALGLRGHRIPNTYTIETGVKRQDGTFEVTVENVAEQIYAEDAAVREALATADVRAEGTVALSPDGLSLTATLSPDGWLRFDGGSIGTDGSEYEYAFTVDADDVARIVAALGGGEIRDVLHQQRKTIVRRGVRAWLEDFAIEPGFWNRFGW